jgi:hypothetical protein
MASGFLGNLTPDQVTQLQAAHAAEASKTTTPMDAASDKSSVDGTPTAAADCAPAVALAAADLATSKADLGLEGAGGFGAGARAGGFADGSAFNAFNAFSFGSFLHNA